METEFLWKYFVRIRMEQARRYPIGMHFEQTCEASARLIADLRRRLAGSEKLSEQEINRRVSLYHIKRERLERWVATWWRKALITS